MIKSFSSHNCNPGWTFPNEISSSRGNTTRNLEVIPNRILHKRRKVILMIMRPRARCAVVRSTGPNGSRVESLDDLAI